MLAGPHARGILVLPMNGRGWGPLAAAAPGSNSRTCRGWQCPCTPMVWFQSSPASRC